MILMEIGVNRSTSRHVPPTLRCWSLLPRIVIGDYNSPFGTLRRPYLGLSSGCSSVSTALLYNHFVRVVSEKRFQFPQNRVNCGKRRADPSFAFRYKGFSL